MVPTSVLDSKYLDLLLLNSEDAADFSEQGTMSLCHPQELNCGVHQEADGSWSYYIQCPTLSLIGIEIPKICTFMHTFIQLHIIQDSPNLCYHRAL